MGSMFVGAAWAEFHIPGAGSLKAKRSVVQSLKQRIASRFNVSVAELDYLDLWQRTAIGVAVIANDQAVIDDVLARVRGLCESEPRAVLVEFRVDHW
jgi:uncharacterized protein YlxP (DUF503 family)